MRGSRRWAALGLVVAATVVAVIASPGPDALAETGQVAPSSEITLAGDTVCSLGFVFAGGDGLAQATTAGHCGRIGTTVSDSHGTKVGTIVDLGPGDVDIARIDVHTTLRVYAGVAGAGSVDNVIGADVLNQQRPLLCKLGAATKLTCGPLVGKATSAYFTFRARTDHGDSGSPVYAVTGSSSSPRVVAAGVLEGSTKKDPSVAVATMIAPFLDTWGLHVSR